MFPRVPRHFAYFADRVGVDLDAVEVELKHRKHRLSTVKYGMGIAINIESQDPKSDMMFHQLHANPTAQKWKDANNLETAVMQELIADPKSRELADKVTPKFVTVQ
jgi:hypothetical protein